MDDYSIRKAGVDCITGLEIQETDFLLAFITSGCITFVAMVEVYFIMPIEREKKDKSLTWEEEFKW